MTNMSEYLEIGPTPSDEDCAQVGEDGYEDKAEKECRRFIDLIRQKIGTEPAGARLFVKWNNHDFGRYAEVCVKYDPAVEAAVDYAFTCESKAPTTWEG